MRDGSVLARLGDRSDYALADGEPDVRGWHVFTREGTRAGEIENVIVSVADANVCYLEVRLDEDVLRLRNSRRVLIPYA
jgi:photosynthetic reaction center H subunit